VVGANVALVALALADERSAGHEVSTVITAVLGASMLASGLLAWRQRPDSRVGPLMILLGVWWTAGQLLQLTHWPATFMLGIIIGDSRVVGSCSSCSRFPRAAPSRAPIG
jgi:hypothetical protein